MLAFPGAGSFCRFQSSVLCMHADACLFLLDSIFEICPAFCTARLHPRIHVLDRTLCHAHLCTCLAALLRCSWCCRRRPPLRCPACTAEKWQRTSGRSAPARAPASGRLPDPAHNLAYEAAPHLAPSGSRRCARYAPSPAAAAHFSSLRALRSCLTLAF